ncbi:MAG: hypothetical protein JNL13_06305, partial [Chitinophagaceae bacterium]|nr:hypothetical protein [Chitinophagaceae bacterium]
MKAYLTITMLFLCQLHAEAQKLWSSCPLVEQLGQESAKAVSYDYTVMLQDWHTGQKLDSLGGHLIYSRQRFIDSNTFSFHARTAEAYCKLDFAEQTAEVFKLDELFRKMKIKFDDEPNKMNLLSADFLAEPGNRVECDFSNAFFNRVRIYPLDGQLLYAHADFRKSDNACIGARVEWKETEDEEHAWKKVMHLYNVSNSVPESAFDLSRVFSFRQGKPVLNGKYARY